MDSHVTYLEFKILSTSANNALKDSSFRISPWVLSNELSVFRAEQIWRSQTPTMLIAIGIFSLEVIHFPPISIKKLLVLVWFISLNAFLSSILAPNKIGSIISVDHPDIPSSANESSQCQYQAISTHAVCSFDLHHSARHISKYCTTTFCLFTTIFNHKWLKHVNTTKRKTWFLG